ncbi:PDZ and LIM domain protein 7-like isoform X2 [Scleropages formosus]|uniref:PDZ and LIM domain protein 7-like isoform X2 n=1 Tax=Scleropages formosus TaxID=113540 RepID=UPI000878A62B|nr:PDZ and LIM domain protein 7-like isoform X2 [Scleropages formosus]
MSAAATSSGKVETVNNSRHGLRMESAPCFIPNDRSKKRLIEDTQDWRPRTGTTQSRSFRILAQLTGTDFMQDPDDESVKRSREKFLSEIQSPRYARLRDWHHDRSARALNIKS